MYKMHHWEMIKKMENALWGPLPSTHVSDSSIYADRETYSKFRPLAHAVNNFHTPFSFHLIKRDLRDLRFTTLLSRKGDMSVNENTSLIYSWEKSLHFSAFKTTPILTAKCLPSQSI